MKKAISVVFVLILVLIMALPVLAENTTIISLGNFEKMAGSEFSVPLKITNNTGISGLIISIKYNSDAITLKSARNGDIFGSFTYGKNLVFDSLSDQTEDGTLAVLTFKISEDATIGNQPIEIIVRECFNDDYNDVTCLSKNGNINILKFSHGDFDSNGQIDICDLIVMKKAVLSGNLDVKFDLDNDGIVGAVDMSLLVSLIINRIDCI